MVGHMALDHVIYVRIVVPELWVGDAETPLGSRSRVAVTENKKFLGSGRKIL